MIKCNKGQVQIKGTLPEILQDTVHILSGVYESIIEKCGEEIANEHIALKEYIIGEQEKMFDVLPEELKDIAKGMFGLFTEALKEIGDE